jgi:hypothetical protein
VPQPLTPIFLHTGRFQAIPGLTTNALCRRRADHGGLWFPAPLFLNGLHAEFVDKVILIIAKNCGRIFGLNPGDSALSITR